MVSCSADTCPAEAAGATSLAGRDAGSTAVRISLAAAITSTTASARSRGAVVAGRKLRGQWLRLEVRVPRLAAIAVLIEECRGIVSAIADTLASAPAPLSEADLADRFTGRGRWRERLPRILDMLVALGNVKQAQGRYRRA